MIATSIKERGHPVILTLKEDAVNWKEEANITIYDSTDEVDDLKEEISLSLMLT